MKPRVTGRIRHVYATVTYVVEMRPAGLTVRRLRSAARYEVSLDDIMTDVHNKILDAAKRKRLAMNANIRQRRRAAKSKNQLPLPIV